MNCIPCLHRWTSLIGLSLALTCVQADETHPPDNRSQPGANRWNETQEPKDWWEAIRNMHGHVGPWNVLGWRIGQRALKEFHTLWGHHELDIVCHTPLRTPYSCLADGLVIGTGNSIGRLDIRLAEVMLPDLMQVTVQRKDGTGPTLVFRPKAAYRKHIDGRPLAELEGLSRECSTLPEDQLYDILTISPKP